MTVFGLRLIALISMLLDHIGHTFFPGVVLLRCIGRLSFPIFAFQLTEGYRHTQNHLRYALRLLLLAVVSEFPFDWMVFGVPFSLTKQNILWTLLLGLLVLHLTDRIQLTWNEPAFQAIATFLILILAASIASALRLDYGGFGLVQIYAFYKLKNRPIPIQIACILALNLLMGGDNVQIREIVLPMQGLAALSPIPISLYQGERGYDSPGWSRFCYHFYPAHMLVLAFLRYCIS